MNGLPYYKAYPRDFIEGTIGMSFELKAAYRLVLDLIYMQGGNLPDDARYISGLLGCTVRKWNALREELVSLGKIEINGEFLTNERAIIELETLRKLQVNQAEKRSRPNKNKELQSPQFHQSEPEPKEAKASSAPARDADEIDLLKSKLLDAVGEKIQPIGAINLGPILGLISSGVDLETDILPTVRGMVARMKRPAGSWSYFVEAIKEAYNARIKAGEGLAKPVRSITPDEELSPEALEAQWRKRLKYARDNRCWFTSVWGAMPGLDGCRVPAEFLEEGDGFDRYGCRWSEQSARAA
uniref:DUF1376 domain-containing protein n=1 Tax=Brucella pseudintermedia TaxID=370111 RepID=UPI00158F5606|nr:DUF1376 domain-containing protein [Brucella pseudintermedia]